MNKYIKKFNMEIIEVGNKQSVFAYTDYPLTEEENTLVDNYNDYCMKLSDDELSNVENLNLPLKKVEVISYDRNKYCYIVYKNNLYSVKSGYLYNKKKRKIHLWDDIFTYETIGKERNNIPYLEVKD